MNDSEIIGAIICFSILLGGGIIMYLCYCIISYYNNRLKNDKDYQDWYNEQRN
jgi:hypothetical protein